MRCWPLYVVLTLALGSSPAAAIDHFIQVTGTPDGGALAFTTTTLTAATSPWAIAAGDVTHEGHADLLVTNYVSNTVSIWKGTGTGTFSARTDFTTQTNPVSVAIGDLNADTHPDLTVANWGSSTYSVLLGNGTGTFGAPASTAAGSRPISGRLALLNPDAFLDLAILDRNSSVLQVRFGNGTGGFGAATPYATGSFPYACALADVNGDQAIDAVVANRAGGTTVSVLLNQLVGTFGPKTDFPAGGEPAFVAIGDLDADGKPDIVVANSTSGTISVLRGNGTGGFALPTDYPVGGTPFCVAIGDLNRDSRLDVVVVNQTSNSISVLTGNGDGTLNAKHDYAVGSTPTQVVIADFNEDGENDLAVTNTGSNTVSLFINATPLPTPGSVLLVVHQPPGVADCTAYAGWNFDSAPAVQLAGNATPATVASTIAGHLATNAPVGYQIVAVNNVIRITAPNSDNAQLRILPLEEGSSCTYGYAIPSCVNNVGSSVTNANGRDPHAGGFRFCEVTSSDFVWNQYSGCRGDLTCDGIVDENDVNVMADVIGLPCSGSPCLGDINGDGYVDAGDLHILAENIGRCCADLDDDGFADANDVAIFGQQYGLPCDPGELCPQDFDCDGVVDESDLLFLQEHLPCTWNTPYAHSTVFQDDLDGPANGALAGKVPLIGGHPWSGAGLLPTGQFLFAPGGGVQDAGPNFYFSNAAMRSRLREPFALSSLATNEVLHLHVRMANIAATPASNPLESSRVDLMTSDGALITLGELSTDGYWGANSTGGFPIESPVTTKQPGAVDLDLYLDAHDALGDGESANAMLRVNGGCAITGRIAGFGPGTTIAQIQIARNLDDEVFFDNLLLETAPASTAAVALLFRDDLVGVANDVIAGTTPEIGGNAWTSGGLQSGQLRFAPTAGVEDLGPNSRSTNTSANSVLTSPFTLSALGAGEVLHLHVRMENISSTPETNKFESTRVDLISNTSGIIALGEFGTNWHWGANSQFGDPIVSPDSTTQAGAVPLDLYLDPNDVFQDGSTLNAVLQVNAGPLIPGTIVGLSSGTTISEVRLVRNVDDEVLFADLLLETRCSVPVRPTDTSGDADLSAGAFRARAYPNPFDRVTGLQFALRAAGNTTVEVYDVAGRLVRQIQSGVLERGAHYVAWDGLDSKGSRAGAGIYLLRAKSGTQVVTAKALRLK